MVYSSEDSSELVASCLLRLSLRKANIFGIGIGVSKPKHLAIAIAAAAADSLPPTATNKTQQQALKQSR
jgi:hypothetical protein